MLAAIIFHSQRRKGLEGEAAMLAAITCHSQHRKELEGEVTAGWHLKLYTLITLLMIGWINEEEGTILTEEDEQTHQACQSK